MSETRIEELLGGLVGPIRRAVARTAIAENEHEIRALGRLSLVEQVMVVSIIAGGEAETVEGAMRNFAESREAHRRAVEARGRFRAIDGGKSGLAKVRQVRQ